MIVRWHILSGERSSISLVNNREARTRVSALFGFEFLDNVLGEGFGMSWKAMVGAFYAFRLRISYGLLANR